MLLNIPKIWKMSAAVAVVLILIVFLNKKEKNHSLSQNSAGVVEKAKESPKTGRSENFSDTKVVVSGTHSNKSSDPNSAKVLISDFFSKNNNIDERAEFCSDIIANLCKNGHWQEAWEMIDSNYGKVRLAELVAYFSNSQDTPEQFFDKIKHLDQKSDLPPSLVGISMRHGPAELLGLLTSDGFLSAVKDCDGNLMRRSVSDALSTSLQMSLYKSTDAELKNVPSAAARLHSQGYLDLNSFMVVISNEKMGDAFEKWNAVKMIDPKSKWEGDAKSQRQDLINSMVIEDANKTISRLLEDKDKLNYSDINTAISGWATMDSGGLSTWYESNQSRLDARQRDSVAAALSSAAMESSEFESAKQWAGKITDPNLRNEKLKLIGKAR